MVENEIYYLFEDLLGENWQDSDFYRLSCKGRVDVRIGRVIVEKFWHADQEDYRYIRTLKNLFYLDQTYCDPYGGLPDPLIVFQLDQGQESVSVVSQEDWFHHDDSKPKHRFRKAWSESGEADVELQSKLNRNLLGWARFLVESGFRSQA